MVGVEPFVLRFWETQFPFLRTRHEPSKHRVYGEREIAILNAIKRLLHKERFTIEGARKHIREHGLEAVLRGEDNATRAATNVPTSNDSESLRRMLSEIRRDLVALREKLLD
jgi:DNA-binding transcriptional MerR regulator